MGIIIFRKHNYIDGKYKIVQTKKYLLGKEIYK